MTRETKIGLLVGLAFIIVIGILLSDHLTNSTEAPPATLAHTGGNVRQTISTPGGTQAPPAVVMPPQSVQPSNPVPTPRELTAPTPASAIVQVGGPSVQTQAMQQPQGLPQTPPQNIVQTATPSPANETPVEFVRTNQPLPAYVDPNAGREPIATTVTPSLPEPQTPLTPLERIAQAHGEQVVAINGATPQNRSAPAASGSATSDYVVQPGDSLSKIAAKVFGSNTKANRDAIVKLNPSLQQDPDKVIVGRTYKIPVGGAIVQRSAPVQPAPASAMLTRDAGTSATEYWYTVKEGDSLWKIASEQLGKGGSGVAAIKELNKETLNGGETVQPNMRLRLPGKPVAQIN
jgi:LysM repeat protein